MRRPILTVLLLAALVAGCSNSRVSRAEPDPLGAAPADFTLDVEVRVDPRAAAATSVAERPARYIVLADASLHAHTGDEGDPPPWFDRRPRTGMTGEFDARGAAGYRPAQTRRLEAKDIDGLWRLIGEVGFGGAGATNTSQRLVEVPDRGRAVIVSVVADGRAWTLVTTAGAGAHVDEASARLVRRLAALAWIGDPPAPGTSVIPRRYDLGPDPYERYR